ncbi:MAG: porin family protein [Pseudomonadota bacterium]|nr:porin family protein [Pseudomonadota bacterium]
MRSLIAFICAAAAAANAQAQDPRDADETSAESPQDRRDEEETGSEFRGEVSASAVIASDRGDDEEADRSGAILRGELDYEHDFGSGEVRLSYDTGIYLYRDDDRPDRWSNTVRLAYAFVPAEDLEFSTRLSYASNIATLEFRSTDQIEAMAMAEYSPGDHRVRVFGGWRWRDYDDEANSDGSGSFFGGEYRYRLGRSRFLTTELRFEDIDSDNPRRGYNRTILEAFYQHPLGTGTRLRIGATARWWEYDGRFVDGERRRDSAMAPELDLQHYFENGWLLRSRFQYRFRDSNDPDERADDRRAVLTAGYRF